MTKELNPETITTKVKYETLPQTYGRLHFFPLQEQHSGMFTFKLDSFFKAVIESAVGFVQ